MLAACLAGRGRVVTAPVVDRPSAAPTWLAASSGRTALPGSGHCVPCSQRGIAGLAVVGADECPAHLAVERRGQVALQVDPQHRAPYATGQQEWCAVCLAAGIPRPRMGVSNRFPGDARPLCIPCWGAESERIERERLTADAAAQAALNALAEADVCQWCGRDDRPTSCRCGYQWLFAARAQHEHDQALAAAAAVRVDELADVQVDAAGAVLDADKRVSGLRGWVTRLTDCLDAMPQVTKTGPRGALEVKGTTGGLARPVFLLAAFLGAHARVRGVGPGRPSVSEYVAAVMAVDADWRSGRRSMAGLDRTAELVGCTRRTVTSAWAYAVEIRWANRTEVGGLLDKTRRRQLRRHRSRSVYDLRPLHRCRPAQYLPQVGRAMDVLAELLEHGQRLLAAAEVDQAAARAAADDAATRYAEARAAAADTTAADLAWLADLDPDMYAEQAATAKADADAAQRAVTAAHNAAQEPTQPAELPAQRTGQRTPTTPETAREQAKRLSNIFHPPGGTEGECFSSYPYLGYLERHCADVTLTGRWRPTAVGRGQGPDRRPSGAASTDASRDGSGSLSVRRPRTPRGGVACHGRVGPGQTYVDWQPTARLLMGELPFLADAASHYGHRALSIVAGVIGKAFTGTPLEHVQGQALLRRILAAWNGPVPQVAHKSPLGYLKRMAAVTVAAATAAQRQQEAQRAAAAVEAQAARQRTAAAREADAQLRANANPAGSAQARQALADAARRRSQAPAAT